MCLLAAASIAATATDVCDEYSFLQARENGAQANGARTKPHAEDCWGFAIPFEVNGDGSKPGAPTPM